MKFPKKKVFRSKEMYDHYRKNHTICERCHDLAVDPHHIIFRSQGGSDMPMNLIALCRACHDEAHGVNSRMFRIELQLIKEGLCNTEQ